MLKRLGPNVARYLLGLMFTVFGLNFFLHFIPQPPPSSTALAYMVGVGPAYVMLAAHLVELVTGILFLANLFVPLALILLAPVVVNIVLFHVGIAPAGLGIALLPLVLGAYLAWAYRGSFAPLFVAKAPLTGADDKAT